MELTGTADVHDSTPTCASWVDRLDNADDLDSSLTLIDQLVPAGPHFVSRSKMGICMHADMDSGRVQPPWQRRGDDSAIQAARNVSSTFSSLPSADTTPLAFLHRHDHHC